MYVQSATFHINDLTEPCDVISRIQRTKISEDCPAFFFNPHKVTNYDFTAPRPSFTRTMAKKSEMGNESCFVLPGGESVLAATMKSRKTHADGRKSYRIYDYDGKRVSEGSRRV